MFEATVLRARVFTDETGIELELPVLVTAGGVVDTLLDYVLEHWGVRGTSWMRKVVFATLYFLAYAHAHQDYSDGRALFESFRQRLLTGTINPATLSDPTGLWWRAGSGKRCNRIIGNLSDLFDWWAERNPGAANPALSWAGSRSDLRLIEAAYNYRRNKAFLGHTWSSSQLAASASSPKGRYRQKTNVPKVEKESPPAFPENRVVDLVLKGFKVGQRYDYRNMLITLLLNGAGFRYSEPFHLYLWDVVEDPAQPGVALVLIHHPSLGSAPNDPDWLDTTGRVKQGNRTEYLAEKFGRNPRNWLLSKEASGWKGGMHESRLSDYYMQAYWFVPELGSLFWKIWNVYIEQVANVKPSSRHHPFAFMNLSRDPIGEPYKLSKFEKAHAAAVRRIGLTPAKHLGTTLHGHRHAYAQRLRKAKVSEEMIRRFMHHIDLESQEVYTAPSPAEVAVALRSGLERLDSNTSSMRDHLTQHLGKF